VAGATIAYAGSATDREDGVIPAARFMWEVVFHHDTHTHPFLAPRSGDRRGSFRIPVDGETSANVWYRIHLTVTDRHGQQATTFRDVRPRVVTLTLLSNPSGMTLTLDGQAVVTPLTIQSVVGVRRSLGIPGPQTRRGATYEARGWADSGHLTRSLATPARSTRFTALFRYASAEGAVRRPPAPCPEAASAVCQASTSPENPGSPTPRPRVATGPRRRVRDACAISCGPFVPWRERPHARSAWRFRPGP
jgi:hypothetical protein